MIIKNIIFDLGNVLLKINTELSKEAFKNHGISNFDSLYTLSNQVNLFDELETGKITEFEFYEKFRIITKTNLENETIEKCWNELIRDYPQENLEILKQIKNSYNTFIISNTNKIHYKHYTSILKQNHGIENLESLVKKAYFSHECGLRKPDKNFFLLVLNKNDLIPKETLFIDDDIRNIKAAKELGIKTYHLEKLNIEKALKNYNLL
ncbi:MAG TPA: HAD family phosphatase [Bacteroidales bacterium]|jgi:putative hydrolase of the HAD superfamily|nr:HAD family phosphatase [Bacteroidales bacterium]HOL97626.1 HAD family phosphatase [Bacteroidales bacterium]HPD23317.1 HAD family phosphatase [Bacteroidales bacterium]HRS99041.1 HAD family phosphatase [Bacteroidales bacterium]HRT79888.1 HAD family phosphatase [Bacteroidales bacterium]